MWYKYVIFMCFQESSFNIILDFKKSVGRLGTLISFQAVTFMHLFKEDILARFLQSAALEDL